MEGIRYQFQSQLHKHTFIYFKIYLEETRTEQENKDVGAKIMQKINLYRTDNLFIDGLAIYESTYENFSCMMNY